MPLTLLKLCKNTESKYDLKLLAGKGGMENTVRWVHMVEDTEVPDFLHGNELVFTTGIANYQSNWLLHFITNLQKNNASGVVINLGPYISTIPPQVIVYCEQHNFPLFTIPWKTRIIDISYEFCRIIINNEKSEQSLTEAFKNLILEPSDEDGYATTLERTGFAKDSFYAVALLKFKEENRTVTSKFFSENESELIKILRLNSHPKAMFIWKKNLVLIYQNTNNLTLETLVDKIEKLISDKANTKAHIGLSDVVKNYLKLHDIYAQAESSLTISEQNNKLCTKYQDLGVYKILLDVKKRELLKSYCVETIGDLIKHDKEHCTDFCQTLKKYCECNGAVNEMAETAGVHRNTINYKMKKIKEILKKDFSYKTIMDLMLAFTILDIIN